MDQRSQIEQLKALLPQCLLPDQVRIGQRLVEGLKRQRTGHAVQLPLARWLTEAQESARLRRARAAILGHLRYPPELPITAWRDEIVAAIRAHPVVVVAGETGSGKTTQLPKMCLEAGLGLRARIGCTQPRRVAALSISRRVAEELRVDWGNEVGCRIRFSDHARPETSVKFMTDGILLAEVRGDPLLAEYEAVILDEAHERSLNIDFLLGYLKLLLQKRDDLKLLITSATIDTARFAAAFGNAPVIEVSGRMYPVEVRYSPLDEHAEDEGEVTYIDAAVQTVERLLDESSAGDLLVFMPGERDIRETCDRLRARHADRLAVVPLFGRLTADEQQRVFAPGPQRRVVVATNIAETSLTVPRIRYVVDTGLARISRYHPGTRSRRLPVEPISQSSANQRKGRCGRVSSGVCVRLYPEPDFNARRPYLEPEIQRCDLADVILRMKAFQLGEIETFPFLDAPSPQAIRSAYQLLQELGALDEQRALTDLGHDLARLPVDPAIGRMILHALQEHALRDVLVIAAGLSIQDPRERPLEQRDAAEAAHRRFQHPQSDFLTLRNIWHAYHHTWESLKTQNQLRKFCKANFLSFLRMREWVDIHAQLEEAVGEISPPSSVHRHPSVRGSGGGEHAPGVYAAIHRAILTGLLGHVARREERNLYRLGGNRTAMVFPGSGLFAKTTSRASGSEVAAEKGPRAHEGSYKQPHWIVAGELLETSRLFVRIVAAIEPEWVIELAPHLIRHTYEQPHWDGEAGRVLCTERVSLHGLVLRERTSPYSKANPEEATTIFIRAALVAEDMGGAAYGFLAHNRRVREKIEVWQTRQQSRVVPDLDEALFHFYAARIPRAASTDELSRVITAHRGEGFLCATETDLLGEHAGGFNVSEFPDAVSVRGEAVPVAYAYAPGEERDGVTLRLTVPLAEVVDPGQLEWVVPALREARVLQLLQLLPKPLRRPLMPLNHAAQEIVAALDPRGPSFLEAMSQFVRQRYGVEVPTSAWAVDQLPAHLRPRLEIAGRSRDILAAGRDLDELRRQVRAHRTPAELQAWQRAVDCWERYDLAAWDFGDLPERYVVTEDSGYPLYAYPGLQREDASVHLRLFHQPEEAVRAHREAVPGLAERVLHRELAWLQKDLRGLQKHGVLYVTLGPAEELLETGWEHLRRFLFPDPPAVPRAAQAFADYVEQARERIPGLVARFVELVGSILQKRQEILVRPNLPPNLRQELDALLPAQFLRQLPFAHLAQLPRYLQALRIRAERAACNPAKDADKARRVRGYVAAAGALRNQRVATAEARAQVERFLRLVEEFKISVFAQELGTAEPVSAKKLDEVLATIQASAVAGK